jgi:hypothetical protein
MPKRAIRKVKWTRDGTKVDSLLHAGSSLGRAQAVFENAIKHRPRIKLTIKQRTRVLHPAALGASSLNRSVCVHPASPDRSSLPPILVDWQRPCPLVCGLGETGPSKEHHSSHLKSSRGKTATRRVSVRLTKRDFKLADSRQELGPVNLVARRSVRLQLDFLIAGTAKSRHRLPCEIRARLAMLGTAVGRGRR